MKALWCGLAIACLLFSGCGFSSENGISGGAHDSSAVEKKSSYPLKIENYDGYAGGGQLVEQVFTKPPERIVATSESTIDNLLFLGLGDKIVGIGDVFSSGHGAYDEEYKKLNRLSPGISYPPKEAIIAARPDILIGWGSLFGDKALGSVKAWHEKGIHTYVLKNTVPTAGMGPRKVEYFIEDLHNLARIFDIEDKAEEKISGLENRMAKIKEKASRLPEEKRPRILTIQYVLGNQYTGRASTDMTADVISLIGGVSLDSKITGKQSVEFLIKFNPDILLIVDMPKSPAAPKIQSLGENPAVQSVNAVKNKHFLTIDYSAFYGGSEKTISEIERLQKEMDHFE